ncbi:MAG: CBS domain-containing protein [Rhodospirillaceae bacterium]
MKIADIHFGQDRELVTISPNAEVAEAVAKLGANNIGALPVCGADGKLVGILSERDIVRQIFKQGPELLQKRIADVMTRDVFTCKGEDDTNDAMEVMQKNRFRHIPQVENGRPVRMISTRDLMGAVLDETREQRRALAVAYELVR